MTSPRRSAAAPCAGTVKICPSPKRTRWGGSSSFDGTSTGRRPTSSDCSATRADRFADRTELNVATASTRVPPAVASEEIVTQSAIAESRSRTSSSMCEPGGAELTRRDRAL